MQNNPKISVIIPVYNVEEYLSKCLESVINQTLKDIEIICINDGSTDDSLSILQEYATKDNRIIIINKENEGVSNARNDGLDIAKGEYVIFIDSDDWIELNTLEVCYNKIIEDQSDMVIFNHKEIRKQEHIVYNTLLSKISQASAFYFTDASSDFFYQTTAMWNKLVRKSFLIHRFHKDIKKCEDSLFFWQICLQNPQISVLDIPLYNYLQREKSAMHNVKLIDSCESFKALNVLIQKEEFKSLPANVQVNILDRFAKSIWWELHILPENHNLTKLYKAEYINFNILLKKYDKSLIKKCDSIKKMKKEYCQKLKIIKLIHQIFNVKNTGDKRHKIITFLGVKLKVKNIKGVWKKEEKWFKKIIKNQKKYPKDTYLLFDCLSDKNTECIDAYSLFTYMKEHGYKTYYILLKDNVLYNKLKESNKLDNVIIINHPPKKAPDEFMETIYDILLRTKCILTSFGDGTNSAERFFRENKYWEYIFIQHGEIYLKECIMKNKYLSPKKFDKFLISSDKECQIFKQYGWPDYKLIKVGIPRWDLLNKEIQNDEKSILFMFTYRRLNQHQFDLSLYKKNLLSLLNNKDLQEYLKSKDIKIYFAPHHALKFVSGVNCNINNTNINIINTQEISKYIKQCSMLVTDFSSIVFDFMFQDKPVICYGLDLNDEMLEKLEAEDLKLLKIKQENFPNILFDEERVINKIKYYVENDFVVEEENLKKYEKFFYTKENIREKLIKSLEDICDSKY